MILLYCGNDSVSRQADALLVIHVWMPPEHGQHHIRAILIANAGLGDRKAHTPDDGKRAGRWWSKR